MPGDIAADKIGCLGPIGSDEVHVVVVGERAVRRARRGAGQGHLIWVRVGESALIDNPAAKESSLEEGFGRGRHGEPVAFVARLSLHGHFALVPEGRVSAFVISPDRDDAGSPIGVGVRIEIALEVDGDFLGAFFRNESRDTHAERLGGFVGGASVDPFFDIDRNEIGPVGRHGKVSELIFLLAVELRQSCADLSEHVAHAADALSFFP